MSDIREGLPQAVTDPKGRQYTIRWARGNCVCANHYPWPSYLSRAIVETWLTPSYEA